MVNLTLSAQWIWWFTIRNDDLSCTSLDAPNRSNFLPVEIDKNAVWKTPPDCCSTTTFDCDWSTAHHFGHIRRHSERRRSSARHIHCYRGRRRPTERHCPKLVCRWLLLHDVGCRILAARRWLVHASPIPPPSCSPESDQSPCRPKIGVCTLSGSEDQPRFPITLAATAR